MSGSSSPTQALAENEVVFRQANERVQKGLKNLERQARAEGHPPIYNPNAPLHFYCECSDEDCRERIIITPSKFEKLHKNNNQFIVLPGHHIPEIEKIIVKQPKYLLVEKFIPVPKTAKKLHRTDVDNT